MPLQPGTRYNTNTFSVRPGKWLIPLKTDTGLLPSAHPNYYIWNVGRAPVIAKVKSKVKYFLPRTIVTEVVHPGRELVLHTNPRRTYFVTYLKIRNISNRRAIVHCAMENRLYSSVRRILPGLPDNQLDVKWQILKDIIELAEVPYIRDFDEIFKYFWPENKPNLWEQILEILKQILDEQTLATLLLIVAETECFREEFARVIEHIRRDMNPDTIRLRAIPAFMRLGQKFDGFEKQFIFENSNPDCLTINMFILPLYSLFLVMKSNYLICGANVSRAMCLGEAVEGKIAVLAMNTFRTYHAPRDYIPELYKECVDEIYNTVQPDDLYDNLMFVRTYIITQGYEYLYFMYLMYRNPEIRHPYINLISYSPYYGRPTPKLIQTATVMNPCPPLTPPMADNSKRRDIEKLTVLAFGKGIPGIEAMVLKFEGDNRNYLLGCSQTGFTKEIEFNGSKLNKLVAYGDGRIDQLIFYLSDGRIITCGTRGRKAHCTFELKNHYIASIHMAGDNFKLQERIGNISVSFQMLWRGEDMNEPLPSTSYDPATKEVEYTPQYESDDSD